MRFTRGRFVFGLLIASAVLAQQNQFQGSVPGGVPSSTPGGTPQHYRDNRVHYIFSHISDYVAVGGVGAVWGTGADGQTDVTTDNGEYQNDVTSYVKSPVPLP